MTNKKPVKAGFLFVKTVNQRYNMYMRLHINKPRIVRVESTTLAFSIVVLKEDGDTVTYVVTADTPLQINTDTSSVPLPEAFGIAK